jgi:hypothetical protein
MNRREFLKVSGIASGLFMLFMSPKIGKLATPQPRVEAQGKQFRGTPNGKIYQSVDKGRTWQLHANLGDHYSIKGFSENQGGQIAAHVLFQQNAFDLLLSSDGRSWLSA